MQRALVSVDDLVQTLTRIDKIVTGACGEHRRLIPDWVRDVLDGVALEAEGALDRAETGEAT